MPFDKQNRLIFFYIYNISCLLVKEGFKFIIFSFFISRYYIFYTFDIYLIIKKNELDNNLYHYLIINYHV